MDEVKKGAGHDDVTESIIMKIETLFVTANFREAVNGAYTFLQDRVKLVGNESAVKYDPAYTTIVDVEKERIKTKLHLTHRPILYLSLSERLTKDNKNSNHNTVLKWNVELKENIHTHPFVDRAFCIAIQGLYESSRTVAAAQDNPKFLGKYRHEWDSRLSKKDFTSATWSTILAATNEIFGVYHKLCRRRRHDPDTAAMSLETAMIVLKFLFFMDRLGPATVGAIALLQDLVPAIAELKTLERHKTLLKRGEDSSGGSDDTKQYDDVYTDLEELLCLIGLKICPFMANDASIQLLEMVFPGKGRKDWNDIADQIFEEKFVNSFVLKNKIQKGSVQSTINCFKNMQLKYANLSNHIANVIQTISQIPELREQEELTTEKIKYDRAEDVSSLQTDDEKPDKFSSRTSRIKSFFEEQVLNPLWEDECRWMNRGKVTLLVIGGIVIWKKRRKLLSWRAPGHSVAKSFFKM